MSQLAKSRVRRSEQGYMLLTLMLFAALLAIAAAAVLPEIAFQTKRDREEELIHRGVQYSRAIRKYVKKFGRYPTSLQDLDNTNQLRFLRKHYKDPLNGKDFKLLHLGEVQATFGPGLTGATAAFAGQLNANGQQPPQPVLSTRSFSQPASAAGAASATRVNPDQSGEDAGDADQAQAGQQGQSSRGDTLGQQVFGGGPIVGVASTSKDKTIREFNKKSHYNEWQFIYDPTSDRGGLLSTPNQPPLQGAPGVAPGVGGAAPGVQGQPGQPTQPGQPIQPLQQPQGPNSQPPQ